ncbi:TDT family transporter [Antrihabitans cavernicola]|uniref:C4-dicarboxylate ABC transporter n=1 Tax=Antrihabitans cavernicola TaxID=2495913 RepID=A0A5A7SIC9_9NOCA|nr:TDT family transporter [Spelaeibacter cavernicola]KAA0024942.1 C4-dicarboxylate ABC transporter [Spelaeibacter cavernicola]
MATTYLPRTHAPRPVTSQTVTLQPVTSHARTSALANITPNWFASVMGTGIVATAAATLPVHIVGFHTFATLVWLLAAIALIGLSTAFGLHWTRHRANARAHADHPVMSQFYGAPPMAMLTVGAGTLLLGKDVIGLDAALGIDWILWIGGTLAGLATSVWIPFRMITAHDHATATALPAWLMPVVPPMVSASTGALLLPHVAAGQARLTMLLACYAMFGLSLIIGLMTLTLVYSRLLHSGMPAVHAAPTVWISLGVIGQSITAANLLGVRADLVFTGDQAMFATGLHVFGLIFGVIMGGFGVLFFALAVALTIHAARQGLQFTLTWWSFTFPIGTCVTGATALGTTAGSTAIHGLAVLLYVLLLSAWATVATHTVRGSLNGQLFLPS